MDKQQNTPTEYWDAYGRITWVSASPREYLVLCRLVIRLIDEGKTTSKECSEMAYSLANYTNTGRFSRAARLHGNVAYIQEAFLRFEIPGDFDLNHKVIRNDWQRLRQYILDTDYADTREPLEKHSRNVPPAFAKRTRQLLAKPNVTGLEFMKLCLQAIKYFDSNKADAVMHSNIAYHITDLWYRKPKLYESKVLWEIGQQFSEWEKPGSFHMDYIVDGQRWELLKNKITKVYKMLQKNAQK